MGRIVQVARFSADGGQVTREFKSMGDAGAQFSQRVQQGARAIPPAMRAVDASVGVAKQKLDGLAGSAGSAGRVLSALGPAGVAAAAALGGLGIAFAALQRGARESVRTLGALYDEAQRLGVSTRALQEWRYAVLGTGAAATQADRAIAQFNEKLGEALLTQQGAAFMALTRDLGFSADDVANMRRAEEALPRIVDAFGRLTSAQEQMRVARELGLEPLLPLLQAGEGAFGRAADAAQRLGYVLDEELLRRASEFNGEWTQAAAVIDVQFKSALVDLAPIFIDLAQRIGEATRGLVEFIDRFRDVETLSARGLRARQTDALASQSALLRARGADVGQGGDAARGARLLEQFGGLGAFVGTGFVGRSALAAGDRDAAQLFAGRLSGRDARDIFAALGAEIERAQERLAGMSPSGAPALSLARAAPGGGATAVDAALNQMRQFVQTLRDEGAARDDLARIMAGNRSLSEAEARSIQALEADLRRLAEARRAGVIASDDELRLLTQLRVARDEEAESARKRAQIEQRAAAAHDRRRAFDLELETPQQRILREIGEIERDPDLRPDQIAAGVRRLREEYRALAEAQYEASLQGQILAGVIQGQIRSFEDLGRTLAALFADAAFRELLSGGVRDGGVGGFFGRVLARVGVGGLFGGGGGAASSIAKLVLGGGKSGGGGLQSFARHPGAELGPEIALFGGWAQVFPHDAVAGLAMLGRAARQAPPAPGPAQSGAVNVTVKNETGIALDVRSSARRGDDGALMLDLMVTRKVSADIAAGRHDDAFGARYGADPQRTRRG